MSTFIVIFFISLTGACALLLRKVYQIERGHIEVSDRTPRSVIPPVSVNALKKNAYGFAKKNTHKALLWGTKWWAVGAHLGAKFVKEKVFRDEKIQGSPVLSSFLKSVSEYKTRVRKIRERLEAHDKAREIMDEEDRG